MSQVFLLVLEEFTDDLTAIKDMVADTASRSATPKVRIAAANSATLLLAARFEEFIRQMAREFAKAIVQNAQKFEDVPKEMAEVVWRRTLEGLARSRPDSGAQRISFFF